MKVQVINLQGETKKSVTLRKEIFGLPVRRDILARVVRWQLAKRRAGTHKARTIGEISGTTAKPWRQKGTGRARAGSRRLPHHRGGAVVFGPRPRSHAHHLTRRFRILGLKTVLSAKQAGGDLVILDNQSAKGLKTRTLAESLSKLGVESLLIVDGEAVNQGLLRAARNIPKVDILPSQGINVYDVLRHRSLALTLEALERLEERLA